jgi:pre-rRNA-processing protein TSR3
LYIAGFKDEAEKMLSIFTWGHTFLELNAGLLEGYSTAKDSTDIVRMQATLGRKTADEESKSVFG